MWAGIKTVPKLLHKITYLQLIMIHLTIVGHFNSWNIISTSENIKAVPRREYMQVLFVLQSK